MNIEEIARMAHEMDRAYRKSMLDFSLPLWECTSESYKTSAIDQVEFHLQNPSIGPETKHNQWLKRRALEGWCWGPVKDEHKKQDPRIISFAKLPPHDRAREHLYYQVVNLTRQMTKNQN
ncbi:RyR domain-containing protein [Algicola sagamiensis]|uniref:RyR domain-containing protein n=1 Tax=Algicola sagamiensis TaxID=163869 RepID=UPI0003A66F4C|nr:RyR domain-containing protein [Algicola sagamiensis]